MACELFDRYNIIYGVLQPPGYPASLAHSVDVGSALPQAWNDGQIERWLAADARYLGSVCVNMNHPQSAAAEIRRAGQHPQMVQVIVTGVAQAFAERIYSRSRSRHYAAN